MAHAIRYMSMPTHVHKPVVCNNSIIISNGVIVIYDGSFRDPPTSIERENNDLS